MEEKSVLVVQVEDLGGVNANVVFDHYGLLKGRDYLLFTDVGTSFWEQIKAGVLQLVLLSHNAGLDSLEVAEKIKDINPRAIVFGFVSRPVELERGDKLDAFVVTGEMDDIDPSDLVKAFKKGDGRNELVAMIEGFGELYS